MMPVMMIEAIVATMRRMTPLMLTMVNLPVHFFNIWSIDHEDNDEDELTRMMLTIPVTTMGATVATMTRMMSIMTTVG